MIHDLELEDGTSFGEWLHQQIQEAAHFENEAWAIQRVRRVEERLQSNKELAERLVTEIPWLDVMTAFTAPGRYITFHVGFMNVARRTNRLRLFWPMKLRTTI